MRSYRTFPPVGPTQDEPVTTFPDARHPAKEHRDKQRQISDGVIIADRAVQRV